MNSLLKISPGWIAQALALTLSIAIVQRSVPLVVIGDVDLVCISFVPIETNSELAVDTDAMLSCAVAFKSFKVVPGRSLQIIQLCRRIQHRQLPSRHALKISRWHSLALACP